MNSMPQNEWLRDILQESWDRSPPAYLREFFGAPDPAPARAAAIESLVAWFDLNKMAEGLRALDRERKFDELWREYRRDLLSKNPPHLVTRWWNR